jgi:hypothetical protein
MQFYTAANVAFTNTLRGSGWTWVRGEDSPVEVVIEAGDEMAAYVDADAVIREVYAAVFPWVEINSIDCEPAVAFDPAVHLVEAGGTGVHAVEGALVKIPD